MPKPQDRTSRQDVERVLGAGARRGWALLNLKTIALVVVIAGAAFAGWRYYLSPRETARQPFTFVTEPAANADLTIRVTATGTVQPTNKVDISSELSGVIRVVNVDFNAAVKKGDVLAELDTVKLQASVEASRGRLDAAKAAVRDAQVQIEERRVAFERKKSLASHSFGSQQELDTAKAAYDRAEVAIESAKANVEMAQAQLRLDETNLTRARIVSPIDGVVLMRKVDPGQTVASSLQAPILFTIAEDLGRMEIQVDVDEADVGKVRDAQKAVFSVDAYPNRRFDAQIRMVRFGSEVVQGVVTYKAVLTTDNSSLLLRPGMTATAEIVVEEIRGALAVPNQALRFQPPQTQAAAQSPTLLERLIPRSGPPQFRPPSQARGGASARVFVLREGQAVPVSVAVGPSDGRLTQIVRGDLQTGDPVIVDTAQRRR